MTVRFDFPWVLLDEASALGRKRKTCYQEVRVDLPKLHGIPNPWPVQYLTFSQVIGFMYLPGLMTNINSRTLQELV